MFNKRTVLLSHLSITGVDITVSNDKTELLFPLHIVLLFIVRIDSLRSMNVLFTKGLQVFNCYRVKYLYLNWSSSYCQETNLSFHPLVLEPVERKGKC